MIVAALTAASGLAVAATRWHPRPTSQPAPVPLGRTRNDAKHARIDASWWIAGPVLGLVIVSLLGLANKRFGVLGGVTDLVQGSSEGRGLRSWRALLLLGIVLGGLAYTLLAGAPDAGNRLLVARPSPFARRRDRRPVRRRPADRGRRAHRRRLHLRSRPDRSRAPSPGERRLDRAIMVTAVGTTLSWTGALR